MTEQIIQNMASTLVKIDIHLIFHTKSQGVKMRENDLGRIHAYMGGIINNLGGIPIIVGGIEDHVHILTSLPKTMALTDFVRVIKADSSKWMKQLDSHYSNFYWQEGYGAFSVSPSLIEKTMNYIRNQAEHHKKRTFRDEYKMFLEAYGIQYDEQFAFEE